ncbi:hypothetical protein TNCV_2354671 [Trichonephila clavipes]|nr:hypothetical protein TNCV_2354671 [Trichonephila clavipes]
MNAELTDMHVTLGAIDCKGCATRRFYYQRCPRRISASYGFSARLHQRLPDSEFFITDTHESERRVRTRANEKNVLDLVRNNPGPSASRSYR